MSHVQCKRCLLMIPSNEGLRLTHTESGECDRVYEWKKHPLETRLAVVSVTHTIMLDRNIEVCSASMIFGTPTYVDEDPRRAQVNPAPLSPDEQLLEDAYHALECTFNLCAGPKLNPRSMETCGACDMRARIARRLGRYIRRQDRAAGPESRDCLEGR